MPDHPVATLPLSRDSMADIARRSLDFAKSAARAMPRSRSPPRSASRSRCAAARSRRSSTTATRALASPFTSASGAATRAPPSFRPTPSSARWRPPARSRATRPKTVRPAFPIRSCSCVARRPTSTSSIPGGSRSRRRSRSRGATEAAALAVDRRITNSEGGTVSAYDTDFILANTRGFLAGFPNSKASISCGVVAEDAGGMQRDYWYTTHRDPRRLDAPEPVGRTAGERTVRRLGGRRLPTTEAPVLFEANIAGSLIGHFVSAASGSSLYRHSSFLLERLGTAVFAPGVEIVEDPHLPRRARQQLLRRRRRHHHAAHDRRGGRAEGLVPLDVLGAQARPRRRPATRAATTT